MKLENAINIQDLQELARRRLPKVIYDYLAGGAEDEKTLRRNSSVFDDYLLRPRVLSAGGKVDLSTDLFGERIGLPFLIGPTGLNGIHWSEGDIALAHAAAKANTIFSLSTASNVSMETAAQSTTGPKWFQLYPWGDRAVLKRLLDRAKASGYRVLVVTVDSLIGGKRERDARNKFAHEVRLTPGVMVDGLQHPRWLTSVWLRNGMPRFENIAEFLPVGANASALAEFTRNQRNAAMTWQDLEWIKGRWDGPVIVKGILTQEDALIAQKIGLDGLVISNHGGRQLDGSVTPLEALPDIAHAVGGNMTILVDGGFRRGSDIVKALALGANAILLGRATLFGLAAGGEAGVSRALHILKDEVERVMALLGCDQISKLTPDHLTLPPNTVPIAPIKQNSVANFRCA